MSLPEVLLWQKLRAQQLEGLKFRRQHVLGPYFADFYCHELRLVVEVDGESHVDRFEHDRRRDDWMRANDLHVLRIRAKRVLSDMGEVLRTIAKIAQSIRRAPDIS